jgi:hypothetical protein
MSDQPPRVEMSWGEIEGGLADPIFGSGGDLALQYDDPEEFDEALAEVSEVARLRRHDEYLAAMVALMEAAGASPEAIVDVLVDEFARGEDW